MPSDFGTAYRLGKADVAGSSEEYDVLLHGRETSCTCPGHCYRNKCKHVDALLAMVAAGKLAAPAAKSEEKPAPRHPYCKRCNDNPMVFCTHCSI
jgi:hypothetical protein